MCLLLVTCEGIIVLIKSKWFAHYYAIVKTYSKVRSMLKMCDTKKVRKLGLK